MKQRLWRFLAVTLALVEVAASGPAQAQGTGILPTPRRFLLFDFLPGVGRGVSTVNNFNGVVAVAAIHGTGKDDKGNVLDWVVDVRAMQGLYLGRDGVTRPGTLAMTSLDVFSGTGAARKQIHHLHFPFHGDVGSAHPHPVADERDPTFGPFWTALVPEGSVKGSPYTGTMTLDFSDAPQHDHFQFGAEPMAAATATVHVEWSPAPIGSFPSLIPPGYFTGGNGYRGDYLISQAVIDFSFTSQVSATDATPFTFTSNREGQRLLFAQFGHEWTGIFIR